MRPVVLHRPRRQQLSLLLALLLLASLASAFGKHVRRRLDEHGNGRDRSSSRCDCVRMLTPRVDVCTHDVPPSPCGPPVPHCCCFIPTGPRRSSFVDQQQRQQCLRGPAAAAGGDAAQQPQRRRAHSRPGAERGAVPAPHRGRDHLQQVWAGIYSAFRAAHTHTRHNRARRLTHPPTIFFLSIKIRFLAMYAPFLFQPIYAFLDPFLAVCEWL